MSYTPPPEVENVVQERLQAWLDKPRNVFRLAFWFWVMCVFATVVGFSDGKAMEGHNPFGAAAALLWALLGWVPALLAWRRYKGHDRD